MIHSCIQCNSTFTAKSTKRKYCTHECYRLSSIGYKKGNQFKHIGSYCEMIVPSKVHGDVIFLVDADDIEKLKKFTWCITKSRTPDLYAMTKDGTKSIKMHRYIMDTPDGMDTDHIDRNTLDNRKSNLRICTSTENNQNLGIHKNHPTGHKYITNGKRGGYNIRIQRNGEILISTYRKSLECALIVRCDALNAHNIVLIE